MPNTGMAGTLENIYGQAKAQREAAAQRSRDAQLQSLETMYGGGIRRVNDAADEAQRQNYIAQQIQKRNLGQEMAAAGLSGGAAESTVLALANQYGANRRATESDRLQQLSALETEWAAQRAAAESAYNERMADIGADWASQLAAAKLAQLQQQAKVLKDVYTPPANVVYPYSNKEKAKREGMQEVMKNNLPGYSAIQGQNRYLPMFTNLTEMNPEQMEIALANGQVTEEQVDAELTRRGY